MKKGILVDPIKGRSKVESKKFELEEMQGFVKGRIEIFPLFYIRKKYSTGKYVFFANEEGMFKKMPVNYQINPFLHEKNVFMPFGAPVGPVLILKENKKGDTISMTDDEIKMFLNEDEKHLDDL